MDKHIIESKKQRISKKLKAELPWQVAEQIEYWGHTGSVNLRKATEGYKVYPSEGYKYFMLYQGKTKNLEMFTESSMGASGVCYSLQGYVEPPAGTWVVELSNWYQGIRVCYVTQIVPTMIA